MVHFIIRGKGNDHDKFGKTRSEQEENLRKEWGGSMNDEQLDKLKFLERKNKEKFGVKKGFIGLEDVDEVK
jgi:hypothetical protein